MFDFNGEALNATSVFDNSSATIKRANNFSLDNIYNYPNPFNPFTTIRYELPEDAVVNVTIFNTSGKVINNLLASKQSFGIKSVQWNATNNLGQEISAGVYLYRIEFGNFSETKKMIFIK